MTTANLVGLAAVNAPQVKPPTVGLIAACGLLGPEYLIDGEVEATDGAEDLQRWVTGYRYAPEQACFQGGTADPYAASPNMPIQPNVSNVVGIPRLIWAGDHCSSFGWSARDYKGRATRALLATESWIIANELWLGTQAQASGWAADGVTWLASSQADVVTSGAVSVSQALNLLEQGIADSSNGQQGMIHCTRLMGSALSELGNTFRNVNGQIETYAGTIICPDAGYPGTGPAGQANTNGSQWAYATLLPQVRRSPIEVTPDSFAEAMTRTTNLLEFRAYRYASATYPPCTNIAVQVNLPNLVGLS